MKQLQSRLEVVQRMWRKQQQAIQAKRRTGRGVKGAAVLRHRTATETQP